MTVLCIFVQGDLVLLGDLEVIIAQRKAMLLEGKEAWINACAYRSPRLSQEAQNSRLIKMLPSAQFTRPWLVEAIVPMAARGERLIVAKRVGHWGLSPELKNAPGVVTDPGPIPPQITRKPWAAMQEFLD